MVMLGSIQDEFVCGPAGIDPDCLWCGGTGYVCAAHPWMPWGPLQDEEAPCQCDADGGMPCKDGSAVRASFDGPVQP